MARDKDVPAAGQQSQAQTGSAEAAHKRANDPAEQVKKTDEPQFFDTSITKLVEREVEDPKTGEKTKEWVEVVSDNLYPGEKLKSEVDAEKAKEKADKLRDDPNDGKKADENK